MNNNYIKSIKRQFLFYKKLGDDTFLQLSDDDIRWQYNLESNSIGILVKHIVGNQLSRWTNFRNEDGEKEWRHRDTEFEDGYSTKIEMVLAWEKGWNCLFEAINSLDESDLLNIIYIRNQGHTITEAINRQLCHYAYHIGQIIYVAKLTQNDNWKTLSIAKNKSKAFNKDKFSDEKKSKHFNE